MVVKKVNINKHSNEIKKCTIRIKKLGFNIFMLESNKYCVILIDRNAKNKIQNNIYIYISLIYFVI